MCCGCVHVYCVDVRVCTSAHVMRGVRVCICVRTCAYVLVRGSGRGLEMARQSPIGASVQQGGVLLFTTLPRCLLLSCLLHVSVTITFLPEYCSLYAEIFRLSTRSSEPQVKPHREETDTWMILRGKVYNITEYMRFHPGGVDKLLLAGGRDGTSLFSA